MKTISGNPTSEKPISLSKAAKILSKFISAENGASHVVSAYLHRASNSFSELNQLHKELKSPRSDRKHKRSRSKTHDINEEPNQWAVHQFDSKDSSEDAEKSSQTIVKFKQEHDEATEHHAGTEGGSEKLMKKKKKNVSKLQEQGDHGVKIEEVEADHKPLAEAGNENEEKPTHGGHDFSQEPVEREKRKKKKRHEDEPSKHVVDEVKFEEGSNKGNAGDDNEGLEEGKKHKKEKKNKKDKDIMNNGDVIKPEDEIANRKDDRKEILSNGVENRYGESVDQKELPNKKKKRHMAGSEDKINTDEVKKVQKKRKNENGEVRDDDESREPSKKKIKKKHGGDD